MKKSKYNFLNKDNKTKEYIELKNMYENLNEERFRAYLLSLYPVAVMEAATKNA